MNTDELTLLRHRILAIQYRTGMSKKLLASVLYTSEQGVRDLLDGTLSCEKTKTRVDTIYDVLPNESLNAKCKTLSESLLDFLREDPLDPDKIREVCAKITEKNQALTQRKKKHLGFDDITPEQGEINLRTNIFLLK